METPPRRRMPVALARRHPDRLQEEGPRGHRNPWRLHVLDLRPLRETPVAETRSADDQAARLDASTLVYALPGRAKGTSDVWTVPVGARPPGRARSERCLVTFHGRAGRLIGGGPDQGRHARVRISSAAAAAGARL
ncbi:hypothetical protein [Streptomyces sp. McG3]|uniref:hypothetical protein n=1 Tax=Streptomyces sp. McG3 TaxID=2725483 RepID=UPI002036A1F4|nr:hypothetical protein [Streptomyces sp. McG3]